MSLTWGEIRKRFVEACEGHDLANQRSWEHITEGYRMLLQRVDVPEAFVSEATVTVGSDAETAGEFLDYVEVDPEVYHIDSVVDMTNGTPLTPEPSGMPGRDRFLDDLDTGATRVKPPNGAPVHWVRQGTRVYLRPCPTTAVKLVIRYRTQGFTGKITSAESAKHPVTPQQFDWPIVLFSAYSYYVSHPIADVTDEGTRMARSAKFLQAAENAIRVPEQPKAEEEKSMFTSMRLAGFEVTPRGW